MLNLDKLLDEAVDRKADEPRTAVVDVFVGTQSLSLKFIELDGDQWAACTIAHQPRQGVALDHSFGYNLTAASKDAAAISGLLLDDEKERKLTPEQWSKLWRGTDAQGRQAITDAIFSINEFAEIERLNAAKKALEGASKRKPRSPAN